MPCVFLSPLRLGLLALILANASSVRGEPLGDTFGQQFCGDGTFGWCNDTDKKNSPREVGPRSKRALRDYRGAVDEYGRTETAAEQRVNNDAQNGVCQGAECTAASQVLGSADNGIGQLRNLGTSLDQKTNQARTELLRDLGRSGASRPELDAFAQAFDRGRRPTDAEINSLAPRTQDYAHALRTLNDEQKFIAKKAEDYGGAGNAIGGMQRKLANVADRGSTLTQGASGEATAGSARYPSGFRAGGSQGTEAKESSLALTKNSKAPSAQSPRGWQQNTAAATGSSGRDFGGASAKLDTLFTSALPPTLTALPEPGAGEVSGLQQDQRELDELSFMVSQLQKKRGHGLPGETSAGSRTLASGAGEGGGAADGNLDATRFAAELLAEISLFARVTSKIRGRWKEL